MQGDNVENANIVAISNPRSGRNIRGGFEVFERTLNGYPEIKHIITQHESDLLQALDDCKQQNTQILIVNGGDGTLLHLLTYLKKKNNQSYQPSLVLLQAGTTSMAYGDVGCKGNLDIVFKRVLEYSQGKKKSLYATVRPVLQMTLPEQNKTICGMFFGAGAIYNGILYCRQKLHTKGMRGEFGPSIAMIRYIFDWLTVNKMTTSTRASIKIDNAMAVNGDFTIITATTLKRLLMGVYPFWGKANNGETISLSLIKRNAPKATKAFIKILRGKDPGVEKQADYYRSLCPEMATLEIHDGFTLDGELFGESGVVTKIVLQSAGNVTFLTT